MKLNGALGISGYFNFRHYRAGQLLEEWSVHNTVTNVGMDSAAGLLGGLKTTGFTYLGIGTSETAAIVTNTDLKAGITAGSLNRVASTTTQVTTDVTNDTLQLLHTWTATATYTIKEAGIFDTVSSGVLLARSTFTGKALEANDTLQVTYKIDVD